MTVVGITGAAGSGKDTIADHLCARHGFIKVSLADPIKDILNERYGFTAELWNNRAWKEAPNPMLGQDRHGMYYSPRQAAQWMGTEVGRRLGGQDVWVKEIQRRINGAGYRDVVIPDIRFDNEARLVDTLLSVYRPGIEAVSAHVSELGVNRCYVKAFLPNIGSTTQLLSLAEAALGLPITGERL